MISHSPLIPLLPQMVQEAASECSDTMGSAHVRCSPPRWQGPYTDMMCLTKAAGEGRGGRQKKNKKGREGKLSELEEKYILKLPRNKHMFNLLNVKTDTAVSLLTPSSFITFSLLIKSTLFFAVYIL